MRMPPRNAVPARDLLEPMRLSSHKGSGHLKEVQGLTGSGFGVRGELEVTLGAGVRVTA